MKPRTKQALLPHRHADDELFICDVLDAIPKDDMASMEHPIFSLATKPDTRIQRYEHKNVTVEIAPSVRGAGNDLRQRHPDLLRIAVDGQEECRSAIIANLAS